MKKTKTKIKKTDYVKKLIKDIKSIENKTSKKVDEVTLNGRGKIVYLSFYIKN